MRLARQRVGALPTLALAALTFVTAVSCRRVFAGWDFLPVLVGVTIGVHAVMALGRMFRIPLLVVTPVAALVTAAVIGRDMYSPSMRFGVLPTRSTWDLAWLDLRDAWRQFPNAVAPVPATGGFLLGAALAVAVVAYTSDTFGFRAFGRVEAVIPSGVVFTFVAALGTGDEATGIDTARIWSGVVWLFVACVAVALLRSAHGDLGSTWLGGRRRERLLRVGLAAATLSVVSVAAAYVVAPRLPGAGAAPLIDPGGAENADVSVVSPIVDIKARLVNRSNRVMFRVKADQPSYWHLTSHGEFDGDTWKSSERFSDAEGDLPANPISGGDIVEQRFTIEQMGDGWVPAAFEAVSVDTNDRLVYNAETSTLLVADDGDLYRDMTYSVVSVLPTFSDAELRSASADSPPDDVYLDLPGDFPSSLRAIAESIVEGAATPFDQALALQNWFHDNFDYDVNVPRGQSESAIETFLNQRRGYCEQFAGTFAAFGRAIGLPTRVSVGFTPGVLENGSYVVRGRNAHAWPEVWFDGYGWVLFEPTPGRGAPGAGYTGLDPQQDTTVGEDDGPTGGPTDQNRPTPTAPRETAPPPTGPGDPDAAPTATVPVAAVGGSSGGGFPTGGVAAIVVVFLVLAWLIVMPRAVRAWALRKRGNTPAERITLAWRDTAAVLGLVGAGHQESETPMEHAERAWRITGIDRASLRWLANAATRAVYAAETLDTATAHESERIRSEVSERVRARVPWHVRLRARFDPRLAEALL